MNSNSKVGSTWKLFVFVVHLLLISQCIILFCKAQCSIEWVGDWYQWPQQIPPSSHTVHFASTIYRNNLFIIGGFTGTGGIDHDTIYILPNVSQHYNISFNQSYWTQSEWFDDPNYGAVTDIVSYNSFTVVDSLLYILSPGRDEDHYGEMFIYNLSSQSQVDSSINPYEYTMPHQKYETPCVTNNNTHIFSIGGRRPSLELKQSNTFQIYSILNDVWSVGPNITQRRYAASCHYDENTNSIYVFGGFDADSSSSYLDSIDKFNITSDEWSSISDEKGVVLSPGRESMGSIKIGDYIYLLGGAISSSETTGAVDVFDIKNEVLLNASVIDSLNIRLPNINNGSSGDGDVGFNLYFDENKHILYKIGGENSNNVNNKTSISQIKLNVTCTQTADVPTSLPTVLPSIEPTNQPSDIPSNMPTSVEPTAITQTNATDNPSLTSTQGYNYFQLFNTSHTLDILIHSTLKQFNATNLKSNLILQNIISSLLEETSDSVITHERITVIATNITKIWDYDYNNSTSDNCILENIGNNQDTPGLIHASGIRFEVRFRNPIYLQRWENNSDIIMRIFRNELAKSDYLINQTISISYCHLQSQKSHSNSPSFDDHDQNLAYFGIIFTFCTMCFFIFIGICGCIDATLCRRNEIFSIGATISAATYSVDIISGKKVHQLFC